MPVALVVDDSEVDRRLVSGLLSQDMDWSVECAANGREALQWMRSADPDVIVTDLKMPDMDGMELVTQVAIHHPHVPIILITAQGGEEVAVEALSRGAVSYVRKDQLSLKLVETVDQVLALEHADRHDSQLITRLYKAEYAFELDNNPALIPPLVELFQQMLMGIKDCSTTMRRRAGIALEEALLNAMLHGNLEFSSEQVNETRAHLRHVARFDAVQARCGQTPFVDRSVHVTAQIERQRATFTIKDDGSGFDLSQIPAQDDTSMISELSGNGLALMHRFMDKVVFNDSGNEVVLYLESAKVQNGD